LINCFYKFIHNHKITPQFSEHEVIPEGKNITDDRQQHHWVVISLHCTCITTNYWQTGCQQCDRQAVSSV